MLDEIKVFTPAKVNFFLNIQRKRWDGYHELLMDLIPVSLFDEIRFKKDVEGVVQLNCNWNLGEIENNLVMKAVRILERESGQQFGLKIDLKKQIPHGAGLGGGSSNAAATLVALNKWLELGISEDRLKKYAAELGADVPFFIRPVPSQATGVGELLTPLNDFPTIYLILIYPGFGISTGEAYQNCSVSGEKVMPQDYSMSRFEAFNAYQNDFWEGLQGKHPNLEICCGTLLDKKAIAAGMSGSGSCLFGIYFDQKMRDRAFMELEQQNPGNWSLYACQTLGKYLYL